jgi:hypothetical protein
MRSEVMVNGVTLTRLQVEKALEELNKPEPYIPRPGEFFSYVGSGGIWFCIQANRVTQLGNNGPEYSVAYVSKFGNVGRLDHTAYIFQQEKGWV